MNPIRDIDHYIIGFPPEIRERLELIRVTISEAAPEAQEVISYGMPAFKCNGILCYFAAFKNHIGFFPTASGIEAFKEELSEFKCTKGTIQIPHTRPVPVDLIMRIIKFRMEENLMKKLAKKK